MGNQRNSSHTKKGPGRVHRQGGLFSFAQKKKRMAKKNKLVRAAKSIADRGAE